METTQELTPPTGSILTKGFRDELDLLGRHIRMLQYVQKHGPIGIIRLSTLLAIPKHKVRYSLRILEKGGYIRPTTAGATATDKVNVFFDSVQGLLAEVNREIGALLDGIKKGVV